MPNHTSFRLNRSGMLLALISAAFAGEAGAAAAGRVDFATAGATMAGRDGQQRPLAKGAELDSGDTVRTDAAGRAQIRFTDGSYVSLQPNTEFAIKDYNFEGKTDGSERGLFGLAKGAMRTVTGLIGRVNRNRYQITTPTATVGIRGTGGRIEVLLDGSTLVAGTSGIWTLSNPSGTIDVPAGTSGKAPVNPDQPPQQTTEQPKTDPAPPLTAFRQGDTPLLINTVTPLVSGSGYAFATAFTDTNSNPNLSSSADATAVFNAAGQLTNVAYSLNTFTLQPGGTQAEFGTDGILAWGRWIGPATFTLNESGGTVNPDLGLHYVIGMPTPVMPTMGSATYTMIGATSPTYTDGRNSPGTFSGSLNMNFGTSTLSGNFNAAMPDKTYAWTATTTTASSLFSMPGTFSPSGNCCGCSASMNGFFAGASAERAGIAYHVSDPNQERSLVGAAAFKKQ